MSIVPIFAFANIAVSTNTTAMDPTIDAIASA